MLTIIETLDRAGDVAAEMAMLPAHEIDALREVAQEWRDNETIAAMLAPDTLALLTQYAALLDYDLADAADWFIAYFV